MSKPTMKVKSAQRWALGMLVISGVVNYVDRAALSVANPLIRQDMGLSVAEMGFLLSAFLWAYAASQMPVGILVDRIGARRLLAAGLTLWSLAQLLGGIVTNRGQFFGARMLLGLGESPQFPTGARVVRDWVNIRHRGVATGIFNCASTLGTALAAPFLTGLMLAFGWRWMFIIMAVIGFFVAILWYVKYREPNEAGLATEERAYLTEGDNNFVDRRLAFSEWVCLFRSRTMWGMIFGSFGTIYVGWIFQAWLPGYLEMQRHMSIAHTGLIAAIPFFCGVIGSLSGGWFSDQLKILGISAINSSKIPVVVSMITMGGCTILAAETKSTTVAVFAISVTMFVGFVAIANQWAMATVASPKNCTASVAAIQNCGGYIGGALAPTITGFIVQDTGSFVPALLVGSVLALLGAVAYFLLIREKIIGVDSLILSDSAAAVSGLES
jgi:MFS family permease